MKQGWKIKKLADVCTSDLGKTLNQSKDTGDMHPYLCAINIFWDKVDFTTVKQTRFDLSEIERYSVRKDDLLICEGGDIGRAAIWDKDETMLYQNALHRVRFDGSIIPRFCLLYLRFLKNTGILDGRYGKGVTIKHLVKSSLLSIPIPVPPIAEQEKIVAELDCLSGIIEKKKQQLKELNNLAQSIFYEMFGDPVENDKGWDVKKLGDACSLKAGKAIKANELSDVASDNLYPCFGGNGIRGYIEKVSHHNQYPIIGRQGALCGNVVLSTKEFYATEHAVVVQPIVEMNIYWSYYTLRYMNLNRLAQGVAQPGLSVGRVNQEDFILPPLTLQQEFASKISSIEKQKELIARSIKETETLFNSRMDYYFN